MASQSALSLLPAIGYALLAALACWLVYRVVITRRRGRDGAASAALPNPVGVGSVTRSAFSFARARARWNGWSLPWPRVPWSSKSGTSNTDTLPKKNLSVELLPTTALPPHPASTPTPTGPLVDLTPPTPPLIPSASASTGPISPRTPSPSHYLAYKGIRAPSPHALLATTSPSKHKRSRSLGGVPVRRLSGGSSGLRNKVDFDLEGGDLEMREFRAGHTRGTSREGLLIDFSSSSGSSSGSSSYPGTGTSSGRTSSESEDDNEKTRISPAASDIGVLKLPGSSPSSLFSSSTGTASTIIATRPVPLVPLVDLSDSPFPSSFPSSSFTSSASFPSSHPPVNTNIYDGQDDDNDAAWKWFGPPTPSHTKIYTPQPAPRPVSVQAWNASAWAPQVPVPVVVPGLSQKERKEKEERLVDVDGEYTYEHDHAQKEGRLGELGQAFDPLDSSKTLVEFELYSHHDHDREKEKAYHQEEDEGLLVDVRPTSPPAQNEATLHDLHDSYSSSASSAAVATGLVPSPSANADARALSLREDLFSDAYATAALVAPLVDVSEHEHDHYEYEQENDHPHEDAKTRALPLPLSLSARPPPQPQATLGTPAAAAATPTPAFIHHPLEDLVPIPLPTPVPTTLLSQVDSKPEFAQHAHEVPVEPRDGLLFSSSPSASVEVLVPTTELSLSALVSVGDDVPMFEFDEPGSKSELSGRVAVGASAGVENGAEAAVGVGVQGWKWDEEEEDPWAGHVGVGGEVEDAVEGRSEEVEGFKNEVVKNEYEDAVAVDPKSLPEPELALLSERLAEGEGPSPALVYPSEEETEPEVAPETPPSPPLPLILLDTDLLDAPASASLAEVEEVGVYPDPELLPLPLPSQLPLPHSERPQILIDVTPCLPSDPDSACLPSSSSDRDANADSKPGQKPAHAAASQTPTPPASPPPVSPLSLALPLSVRVGPSSGGASPVSPRPSPISPRPSRGNLRVSPAEGGTGEGDVRKARSRPVSPRVDALGLPEDRVCAGSTPKPLWAVNTAERVELLHEQEQETAVTDVEPQAQVQVQAQEAAEANSENEEEEREHEQSALPLPEKAEALADDEDEPPSPLPGSFPSSAPPVLSTSPSINTTTTSSLTPSTPSSTTLSTTTSSTTTIAARLAASPTTPYRPSARSIIRSPLDVALAMQLRPGLGLGADPAWMVRFLMAMWGWLAVVVSGQGGY